MIVKGRELVRFVSTLSQFLLFSSSSLPYSFYSFPLFLSFSSFFPVYYTYIYSRPQKFSHEIDKSAIFKLKKKKRNMARYSRFEIWDDQRETYFLYFIFYAYELLRNDFRVRTGARSVSAVTNYSQSSKRPGRPTRFDHWPSFWNGRVFSLSLSWWWGISWNFYGRRQARVHAVE